MPFGLLVYIHLGLADFLGGFKILNFNIYFFFRKYSYFFGLEIFVGIVLGVTSKLDNFHGLFLQIKCSCMCSVMKSTLIHT